jgi:ABC-type polysaccharide/polyol phosphate transport system ATPase subunit
LIHQAESNIKFAEKRKAKLSPEFLKETNLEKTMEINLDLSKHILGNTHEYLTNQKLEIINLSKTFGLKTRALTNIDLSIEEEETIALIGANGAGKTTLVEILARVQKQTSGEIKY